MCYGNVFVGWSSAAGGDNKTIGAAPCRHTPKGERGAESEFTEALGLILSVRSRSEESPAYVVVGTSSSQLCDGKGALACIEYECAEMKGIEMCCWIETQVVLRRCEENKLMLMTTGNRGSE